jgi:molecular chaperone GrpE
MNADQPPRDESNPGHAQDTGEPNFAPSETAPVPSQEPAPALDDATAHIEHLEGELAALNDKLLRSLAEAENVRRRAQRDKEDASKYAIKGFAEDMLRVADNLGRALAAIDADARKQDANLETIAVGVEMVMKELLSAFERAGVKPIEAEGQRFDPMLHEAMYELEDPSKPAGTVAQVLEQGFTLHGRTLRAAKVGVTKGGPKPEAKSEAPAAEAERPQAGAGREGQHAYEHRSDGQTGGQGGAGHQFDEKL